MRTKIYEAILFNKRFPKSLEVSKMIVKDEEEKEEKKEEDINFDLEKFFKDNNAPECINKL